MTTCGFACPFVAFITCPTKAPKSLSFPDLYCSTKAAFSSRIWAQIFSSSAVSDTCASPFSSTIFSGSVFSAITIGKISLAIFPEIFPDSISEIIFATCRGSKSSKYDDFMIFNESKVLRGELNLFSKVNPDNSNGGIYARLGGSYDVDTQNFYPQIMVGYATNLSSFINKFSNKK